MWETVKLGDISKISYGYTAKASFEQGSYKFLRITDIQDDRVDWGSVPYCEVEADKVDRFRLSAGDIVFARTGATTGKSYLLCDVENSVFASYLIRVKPNQSKVLPAYLSYYFKSSEYWEQIGLGISGAAQGGFNASKLADLQVPLPSLAAQQRIVAKLDAAFAEIDRALEIEIERTRQIDNFYESALNELHDNDGSAVKLADVCGIEASLIDPKEPLYQHKKHVGAGNIVALSNDLIDVQTAEEEGLISGKYPFDATTILYSKIRPYLRKVHMPNFEGICSADMYPLTPKSGKLDRNYLYYLLLSQHFTEYAMAGSARSGMPKVNRKHLFNYEFKLPPLERQKELAARVTAVLQHVAEYRRATLNKQQQFERLRAAALAQELRSEAA